MKTPKTLLFFLIFTSLLLVFPTVNAAQTTRIYELVSPIHTVAGGLNPIPILATVFYNDSAKGNSLAVAIFDMDQAPHTVVPGLVTSSADSCVNPPLLRAVCLIQPPAGSGVENLEFMIGGILGDKRGPGVWDLNMTAVLVDSSGRLIAHSISTILFAIQLTPAALRVIVPANVAVSIDGVKLPPGPVQVGVAAGKHNITLPSLAQVDATTRVRFDHWADGLTALNRTFYINNDTSIEAVYVTQYMLTITGPQLNATGAGWYDASAAATFSVPPVEQMSGPLGLLGGKLRFQGWYENGTLLTDQTSGAITMSRPYSLAAVWQEDYSVPVAIIVGILIILVSAYVVARRRSTLRRTKRRSRSGRRKVRPRT